MSIADVEFKKGLVCEYPVTSKMKNMRIVFSSKSQYPVASLVNKAKNVAIIGDTGCRNSKKFPCKLPSWGFLKVLNELTKKRSLLIHLGDYRYNSVKKDNFDPWMLEFFCPFADHFNRQPNVFLRGNHEACTEYKGFNGANGYFLFFSATKTNKTPKCVKKMENM